MVMSSGIGMIEVNKVSTSYKVRSTTGGPVVNPHSATEVRDEEVKIQTEVIRTEEIKSFRPWAKTQDQEAIEGDITIIYFKEDPLHTSKPKPAPTDSNEDTSNKKSRRERKTTPMMLINENFRDFGVRIGAIMLTDEEK